ncbi:60S ribosomal protein L26-like 1 [Rattus rattus]|uniref:60S ribosomal protein L26-like 1 n=1 Tax=Rattus rattus TaxID=10117 RepID=UPI0013F2DF50|nr:60S ribosomal protein L26-like 1 [Rattus rattus]
MSLPLSKELRQKYCVCSMPIRKDNKVQAVITSLESDKDQKITVELKAKSPKVGKEKGRYKELTGNTRVNIIVRQGLTSEASCSLFETLQSMSEVFRCPPVLLLIL